MLQLLGPDLRHCWGHTRLGPDLRQRAANQGCSASPSGATDIRANCSCMAPRMPCPRRRRAQRRFRAWLRGLLSRAHANTAVVALANKSARIAWAVLRSGGI